MATENKPTEQNVVKATDMFFGNGNKCDKCIRHQSECFVKDICKGFQDKTCGKNDKFEQYDEVKAITKHTNEGFLGKA